MDICIMLAKVLEEPERGEFFARREDEAHSLVNLLQAILDYASLSPSLKRRFTSALIRLSSKSGRFPDCMVLEEVTRLGEDPVAAGSFGEVWKGSFYSEVIAMKVLKVYERSNVKELLKRFSAEIIIWRQLSHPNLIPFYGVYYLNASKTRICLISPWMQNGNVVQYLRREPDIERSYLMLDIARGLEYLHSGKPGIVHGDLKGENILITSSRRACLTDFGLASARDSELIMSSSTPNARVTGTLRWQAPELLNYEAENTRSTFASDVYSFGCVGYEIYSGEIPFHEVKSDYYVMQSVTRGARPPRPPLSLCQTRGLDDTLWAILQSCWLKDAAARPTAEYLSGSSCRFLKTGKHDIPPSPNKVLFLISPHIVTFP
ncbi:hypothetical protein SERLADRAFT_448085 [Serpula lacrymans var. lacrymans S7.9]|uniref:Protein kinase domain-containing protein n=1 Tax=Serpula lacrymans var. lacrymans (strain S7.9) TaxID=578457 RepID=F8NSQ0_SERL9|nr:uncharacterized protein SERLADRAFT_448085 [Serpula lacrymans var. lacrymans S7.9]EGO26974.1 hypothetical protein SERLADRAFT_448085 [Serpula lacrymans var. lacrymans S7.9]